MSITIRKSQATDVVYALKLSTLYKASAARRKTGIATRSAEYISTKIEKGDAIIALENDQLAGFCYIETFTEGSYVSNSGLIVDIPFQGLGLASKIKNAVLTLAREKYPDAQVFGITTSPIVMNINFRLGYKPVPFHQLTDDEEFWNGCKTCVNYDVLTRNRKELCLCTGMIAPSGNELQSIKKKKNENKEK